MQANPMFTSSADDRLSAARHAIDLLDDELLRLIEQRFALSAEIAALKSGDDRSLKIRPKREAEVLHRLTNRATTATPALIAHVWRELMAHSVQAQVATELVIHAPAAGPDLDDRVRERFGRAAPIRSVATPTEAIASARDAEAIAVVALDDSGWWTSLAGEPALAIFDTIETASGSVLLIGRIAANDLAPGHALTVEPDGAGGAIARSAGYALCREGTR